jgi:adenine/guanine phosphoribosyltransferase-like PRPP-binding protein
VLGGHLDLPVYDEIVQINKVGHTGASGYHHMAYLALFDGEVRQNATYLLVDDFIGQGGTLANLKGYIESKGGGVVLATTGWQRH